ncbi:MAG: rRNA maturation RNase YbeY [Clostridia bacterium]
MKVEFENIKGFWLRRKIKLLALEACRQTKQTYKKLVFSVSFVNEKTIQELNKKHREIDKVTDVLSFPMLDLKPFDVIDTIKFANDMDKQSKYIFVGDVVICLSKAIAQSKEYGHFLEREICFLALHGFLHVLGFDHINEEDELVMQELAEKIMKKIKLER